MTMVMCAKSGAGADIEFCYKAFIISVGVLLLIRNMGVFFHLKSMVWEEQS
jgi:hypothetical protein